MQHSVRSVLLGIALAALAPGVCLAGVALIIEVPNSKSILDTVQAVLLLFLASFPVAAVPAILLGLPFVLWLRSRNALSWFNVCFGAAVIGAIALAALSWGVQWEHRAPTWPSYFLGAGLGLAGGLGFCLGAWPNNSFKPKPLRGSA